MFKSIPSDTDYDNAQRIQERISQDADGPRMYIGHVLSHIYNQNRQFNHVHKTNVYAKNNPEYIQLSSVQSGLMMQKIWSNAPHRILNLIDKANGYNYSTYNRSISIRLGTLKKMNSKLINTEKEHFHGSIINPLLTLGSSTLLSDIQTRLEYDKTHPNEGKQHQSIVRHLTLLHGLYKMTKKMTVKNPYYKRDYLDKNSKLMHRAQLLNMSKESNKNKLPKYETEDMQRGISQCTRDVNIQAKRKYRHLRHEIHNNYADVFKGTTDNNVLIGYAENPVLGDIYKMTAGYQELKSRRTRKIDMQQFIKHGQKLIGDQLYKQDSLNGKYSNHKVHYSDSYQLKLDQNAVVNFEKKASSTKKQDNNHNLKSQETQQKPSRASNQSNVAAQHSHDKYFSIS